MDITGFNLFNLHMMRFANDLLSNFLGSQDQKPDLPILEHALSKKKGWHVEHTSQSREHELISGIIWLPSS